MLKPKNLVTGKKTAGKKPAIKKPHRNIIDLPPRKNPRAGGGLYPKDPPFQIPPEGFIKAAGETEKS
jgi:hypothetical protein